MSTAKIPIRVKGQTTCFYHKERELELYCEECQDLACVKCAGANHRGHGLCDLSETTPQKKQEIRNFVDRTEQKDLVQIGNYIASTNTLFNENDGTFEKLSEQLKEQTEKLKQNLDTLTAETLSLYQKMKDDNTKLIQIYKQNLVEYENELKQQMQECKNVLQQGSHIEIYDTKCDFRLHLPVKPVLSTASFNPNTNPCVYLELALGICKCDDSGQTSTVKDRSVSPSQGQGQSSTQQKSGGTMKMTSTKLLTETKMLEEWTSPCRIDSICPTNDDKAWAQCGMSLTLLNRKGKVIQEVTHKTYIKDISLSPTTHRLWACDQRNNILELVSGILSKTILVRFRTMDQPRCICVTADDHIILGMSKHMTKYTTKGQIVRTTKAAMTATRLVFSPRKIKECPITSNIAVLDHRKKLDGGDEKQHVVVMDADFQELFTYKGDIPSRPQKLCFPQDMVYDSHGNIIIADNCNGKILILNGDGQVLRMIYITGVWTVGESGQDVLWTASKRPDDWYVFKAHDVKLLQYYE